MSRTLSELQRWKYLLVLLIGGSPFLWYFDLWDGIIHLTLTSYFVVVLTLTHITIAAVTIFLHRGQAHRAIDFKVPMPFFLRKVVWVLFKRDVAMWSPVAGFFRPWLWLTTGMVTKEWAAIHRKHHATCETMEDPHSPKRFGILRVLFGGVFLYVTESRNKKTIERFGFGTPDDWVEDHVYTKYHKYGVIFMLLIDLALFGPIVGVFAIWLVQMMWIPLLAAGVINGWGHYWGYRNFPSMNLKEKFEDWSTNIVPVGILIGGEELHNNHHHYPYSAKLSVKWFEFDIGWMYIRIFETFGLLRVKYAHNREKTSE